MRRRGIVDDMSSLESLSRHVTVNMSISPPTSTHPISIMTPCPNSQSPQKNLKKREQQTSHNPLNLSTICLCTNSSVPGARAATVGKHAPKLPPRTTLSSVWCSVDANSCWRRVARGPGTTTAGTGAGGRGGESGSGSASPSASDCGRGVGCGCCCEGSGCCGGGGVAPVGWGVEDMVGGLAIVMRVAR